ncbi:MAG: DNA topoisomerase VI subunit B [archaeon]
MTEQKNANELAKEFRSVSVSDFFARNRHLLGYDNPIKALLTVIKEGVDNSVDACEEAGILPDVYIEIKQLNETRFIIILEDNGPGIVKKHIPNVFASLLYGTKFHRLRQSRGVQGIGISSAVLYAQLTTAKPTKIWSKIDGNNKAFYYELHINTQKNEPEIVKEEDIDWPNKKTGIKIELEIEAKYQKGQQSVDQYLKQTAIANPHLQITYISPLGEKLEFPRATKELPKEPKRISPHPYGIELGILMKMLSDTKHGKLSSFLQNEFCRVSPNVSKEICEKASLPENSRPSRIARQEAEKLFKAIQETKIMAPPTDCLSPIGQELLEKGLKKEINADFYASVTRSPSVYRGNPFQIECCTGDTKLISEEGGILNIKDFVENKINKKVFAMDSNLKIRPVKVIAWHKFKNKHKILKIKTKSGRSLKITDNNQLPIIENGEIIWKESKDVMAGDFIASPRKYNIKGYVPNILDLFKENEKDIQICDKEIIILVLDLLKNKFSSLKKSSKKLNIDYDYFKAMYRKGNSTKPSLDLFKRMCTLAELKDNFIYNIKKIRFVNNRFKNPKSINIPKINEDLFYVLGLLNSDGFISKKLVSFVNKDEYLHSLYSLKIYQLFGLKTKRYNINSSIYNKTLSEVLNRLEKIICKLPDYLVIAWLKGFVDGDGWVNLKDGVIKRIGITTAKEEKAEFTQFLLLRLGIISKIERKGVSNCQGNINGRIIKTLKPQYNIIIRDFENINKFSLLISFRQLNRSHLLSKGLIKQLKHLKDIVPLGKLLKRFREENNLYQYELGFSDDNIRSIEKGNYHIGRGNLQKIIELQNYSSDSFEKLKNLAYSDVLWDKITDIELVENENYVYDLTTEVGNFVADNIIMHNCAIAYGGDIEKEDVIRLLRFANRVPLLYQKGACAVTRAVGETNWKQYGLQQSGKNLPVGPIVLVVHIASVWVPFTSEAKEAIAHYPEIIKEIKLALQECGRQLGIYIRKHIKAKEQKEKANLFEKYIPELASSLSNLTGDKKDKIEEDLLKILKKGIPEIEENGQIEK